MPTSEDGKLVILGDTHGQLSDFLWVLKQNGEPSPSTAYLLNGRERERVRTQFFKLAPKKLFLVISAISVSFISVSVISAILVSVSFITVSVSFISVSVISVIDIAKSIHLGKM